MKAITPVVSLVLLIIIVIVVVGFSFGFFGNLISSATSSTEEEYSSQIKEMGKCLMIEAASGDTIYVRNCGTSELSGFTITADGMFVPILNSPTIMPSTVGMIKINLSQLETGRDYLFTISSGYVEDTITFSPGDKTQPTILLLYPNNASLLGSNIEFSCNATDDNVVQLLELKTNRSSKMNNEYNITGDKQNLSLNYSISDIADGSYVWTCCATDDAGNGACAQQRTFIVSSPILYMPFDDDIKDYSGSGLETTCTDCPTFISDTPTGSGKAAYFNNSYVNISDDGTLDLSAMSISFWIKPDSYSSDAWKRVLATPNDFSNSYVVFYIYNEHYIGISRGGDTYGANISKGIWQHVIIGYNETGDPFIYINGTKQSLIPHQNSANIYSGNFTIGMTQNKSNPFYGAIDELRIYNRILTQDEINILSSK